jgi:hypothetical protein
MCDGWSRRDLLHVGAAGALGLSLPGLLRASDTAASGTAASGTASEAGSHFGVARRCLLVFLTGGPPQHETWDPKPHAPEGIRGTLSPIETRVPGLRYCELFPQLALHADKLCTVRSVTHLDRVHTSAGYTMLTGVPHPAANSPVLADSRPGPHDHPHFGALAAKVLGSRGGVPPFASLPEVIKDANVNEYPGLGSGLLGSPFSPFRIEANEARTGFRRPEVFLPDDLAPQRFENRQALLRRLDASLRRNDAAVEKMDGWYAQAFDIIRSPGVRAAFDLAAEEAAVRERYGSHLFGQGCLMARRLLEAGVRVAAVYWHYEGPDDSPVWDTHWNNERHLKTRLAPPTDQAVSALLGDMHDRGMLSDTLVIVMGEFGRTPRINSDAGRDHWSGVQSLLLAGAGVAAGTVYGASDRIGSEPSEKAVDPADLMATFLHLLGVPPETEVHDRTGRPIRACVGTPVWGLLA